MKPGDLVEFKAGLFGIAPPKNLGIYLERVKRKGSFFVVLHTVKGQREIKPENVTGRKLAGARVEPPFDEAELSSRLDAFVKEFSDPAKKEKPTLAPGEMNDRALWNKVWEHGPQSPQEMAERFFVSNESKKTEIEQVRNALANCARPGVGYFEREPANAFLRTRERDGSDERERAVSGRSEVWRPLTLDQYRAILREVEGLNKLRKKLVKVVEDTDPETNWIETRYVGVRAQDAALDDDDRARLALVARVMASFVHHDRDAGEVGYAGTNTHTIDGNSLFSWVKWLAMDWTQTTRVSLSSTFVQFLIENGVWTLAEALTRIAKRKVAQHASFAWDADPLIERVADRFTEATVAAEAPRRKDLRDLTTWTIDPADARDHDDAISLTESSAEGTRTLWVHIADVSHYVTKDDALDRHAKKRATSVYLPTGVLPMLPHSLSDTLCSLNVGVDRLALTAALSFDRDANLVKEEFFESVVRVTGNVAYEEVLAEVEAGNDARGFVTLEAFARELDTKRRGLVLETGERRVRVTGDVLTHAVKQGSRATKMIEVFMVAANEAVARRLTAAGVAIPFRCHPLPDRVSVTRFNAQMRAIELPIEIVLPAAEDAPSAKASVDAEEGGLSILDQLKKGGKLNLFGQGGMSIEGLDEPEPAPDAGEAPAPAAPPVVKGLAQLTPDEREAWLAPFRAALSKVREIPEERLRDVVYGKTLSCMGRAIYTPRNLGHFGLGSACYCHFTSPIRRYPDLVVHRQLRAVLRGEPPPHGADLEDLSIHCSEQGGNAESLERGVVDSAMVFASLSGGWDGPQSGIANGITKSGVFLSLPRGLEARLAGSDIPGGPWSVDDADSMLFAGSADRKEMQEEVTAANWRELYDEEAGEVRRVRVRLGDELLVTIAARDFVDGRVSAKLAGGDAIEPAAEPAA